MFKIKTDLTVTMRHALLRAWQFKKRMPDRAFTAVNADTTEATMRALVARGFLTGAGYITYEFTERGREYADFHFGALTPVAAFGAQIA